MCVERKIEKGIYMIKRNKVGITLDCVKVMVMHSGQISPP